MLHRAILGSFERFMGIITEHFAGAFPTWLAPNQVRILPVNNLYHSDYAHELEKELKENDIRVIVDDSSEKLGYRMRNSITMKTPYTLVIGDKEKENNTVTYRKYGTDKQISITKEEFIKLIKEEIKSKALLVDLNSK